MSKKDPRTGIFENLLVNLKSYRCDNMYVNIILCPPTWLPQDRFMEILKTLNSRKSCIYEVTYFMSQQDARLGIESVGHIGKDSNNNRSK